MDNRTKTRIAVALAAVIMLLLLAGTFWLLIPNSNATTPDIVADTPSTPAAPSPARKAAEPTAENVVAPAPRPAEPAPEAKETIPQPKPEKVEPAKPDTEEEPKSDAPKPEGEAAPDDGEQPDPEKPLTVDFVNRDIQTIMHYIGLRSGLNITLEGSLNTNVTVMFRNKKPRDVIRDICNANDILMVEDGDSIILKKR